jgi:hypothetical protein
MRPTLAVGLAALLVLAGCGGAPGTGGGSGGGDCTPATATETPRAEPVVLVAIANEEVRNRNVSIRVVRRHEGNRTVLFDSSVGLSPVNEVETRTRFPSRNGTYLVRASAGTDTARASLTVPEGRLQYVSVRIASRPVEEGDGNRVTLSREAVPATPINC